MLFDLKPAPWKMGGTPSTRYSRRRESTDRGRSDQQWLIRPASIRASTRPVRRPIAAHNG